MDAYSRYSRMVTDIIAEQAPVYEKASIDEHYLDITGLDRFFDQKVHHRVEGRLLIMSLADLPLIYRELLMRTGAAFGYPQELLQFIPAIQRLLPTGSRNRNAPSTVTMNGATKLMATASASGTKLTPKIKRAAETT